ncbi:MAG: hypothetical protein MK052_03715 [Alphaproteobacteria bacterium]|nr:hypothetical protein [Alphaproteobacteria bacterium]
MSEFAPSRLFKHSLVLSTALAVISTSGFAQSFNRRADLPSIEVRLDVLESLRADSPSNARGSAQPSQPVAQTAPQTAHQPVARPTTPQVVQREVQPQQIPFGRPSKPLPPPEEIPLAKRIDETTYETPASAPSPEYKVIPAPDPAGLRIVEPKQPPPQQPVPLWQMKKEYARRPAKQPVKKKNGKEAPEYAQFEPSNAANASSPRRLPAKQPILAPKDGEQATGKSSTDFTAQRPPQVNNYAKYQPAANANEPVAPVFAPRVVDVPVRRPENNPPLEMDALPIPEEKEVTIAAAPKETKQAPLLSLETEGKVAQETDDTDIDGGLTDLPLPEEAPKPEENLQAADESPSKLYTLPWTGDIPDDDALAKEQALEIAAKEKAAEKEVAEKLAAKLAAQKAEAEEKAAKLAAAEAEKAKAKQEMRERVAAQEAEEKAIKMAAEKKAAEEKAAKLAAEKEAAEQKAIQLAAEKQAAEEKAAKLAAEKEAAEQKAAKLAAEKAAAEKRLAEEAAANLAAEKQAAAVLAAEKLAAEKLAAEKIAAEKIAAEEKALKLAADKAAAEKLALKQKELDEQLAKVSPSEPDGALELPPLPGMEADDEASAETDAEQSMTLTEMDETEDEQSSAALVPPLPDTPVAPKAEPKKEKGLLSGLTSQIAGLLGADKDNKEAEAKFEEEMNLPPLPKGAQPQSDALVPSPDEDVTEEFDESSLPRLNAIDEEDSTNMVELPKLPPLPSQSVDEVPVATTPNRALPSLTAIVSDERRESLSAEEQKRAEADKAEREAKVVAAKRAEKEAAEKEENAKAEAEKAKRAKAKAAAEALEAKAAEDAAKKAANDAKELTLAEVDSDDEMKLASLPDEAIRKLETPVDSDIQAPVVDYDRQNRKQVRLFYGRDDREVLPVMQDALKTVVKDLKDNPQTQLKIQSYAGTNMDDKTSSNRMSLGRALALRAYMIEAGIPTERVIVSSKGNDSAGGPAERVDITID